MGSKALTCKGENLVPALWLHFTHWKFARVNTRFYVTLAMKA
jgi:hypothetical protein